MKIKKHCLNCKKAFKVSSYYKDAKYCSRKCYHKNRIKGSINICLNCKKKFYVRPSWKKQKYCSSKCYFKFINKNSNFSANYKDGRTLKIHKCPDCGKEILYFSKKCHLCENKRRTGKNSPRFGKISHGKWGKYKGIWMRSSYEIAYAKWLSKNKYKWQYEPKTFDLGNTTYTPDFYLPEKNMYIEVKGWWRADAKEKFEKFKKLYPEINIQIEGVKSLKKYGIIK